ncbi:MAG: IS1595 family transposase [Pyrinomonadaceae bacterium]
MTKTVKQKQEMDLITLMEKFGSEDKCFEYLEALRFPDGVKCIRCRSDKISRIYERRQYHCDSCTYQFSVRTDTIFHGSHLPLQKWFCAVYLMCESRKGISANQLKRTLKVAYKTAWYLCHRIRKAVKNVDDAPLTGFIECDETFVSGKAKNIHKPVKEQKIQGLGSVGKAVVLGAKMRDGDVRLEHGKNTIRETLHAFIKAKIAGEAECIMTDEFPAYNGIADADTRHEKVNHSQGEYVRYDSGGNIHTNGVENVRSLFKRSIVGAYHQISDKHLDRYLDEMEFRFNNRNNPYIFRDTILQMISSDNLEYQELIKEVD